MLIFFLVSLSNGSKSSLVQSAISVLYLTTPNAHWFIPINTFLAYNSILLTFLLSSNILFSFYLSLHEIYFTLLNNTYLFTAFFFNLFNSLSIQHFYILHITNFPFTCSVLHLSIPNFLPISFDTKQTVCTNDCNSCLVLP